ncbi:MAG: nitroreductase family protein [bacterium]|nr:nitroreductase family protein [bacterium]
MSNTYDTILRLRAIREYADRSVEPEDLRRVLEAARWTGSAKNRQNWSIILVDERRQMDRLAGCASFAGPLSKAPVALALVQEGSTYGFDIGRMAQNIMLAASAIGMVSCPITLHDNEKAHEVLEIPEGRRCRYAIALGYPSQASRPAKAGGRKPLEEIIHHNSYGARTH